MYRHSTNTSDRTQKIDILLLIVMVVEKYRKYVWGRCNVVSVYLLLVTLYPISMSMSKMSLPRLYLCALEEAYILNPFIVYCRISSRLINTFPRFYTHGWF